MKADVFKDRLEMLLASFHASMRKHQQDEG